MEDKRKRIEVCYTPREYDYFKDEFEIVVVIDVLRATLQYVSLLNME